MIFEDRPASPGWHVYETTWGKDRLVFAVESENAMLALKRLIADDPAWKKDTVKYHGFSLERPNLRKVRHRPGYSTAFDFWKKRA